MRKTLTLVTCIVAIGLSGCEPSTPPGSTTTINSPAAEHDHGHEHNHVQEHGHDHDADHAETLPGGVQQVAAQSKTILAAFEAGTPEEAHDELHKIGHLIEALPELAVESELSGDAKQSVRAATEKLMVAFGELDETLHDGPEANLDEVKQQVEEALKTLEAVMVQAS